MATKKLTISTNGANILLNDENGITIAYTALTELAEGGCDFYSEQGKRDFMAVVNANIICAMITNKKIKVEYIGRELEK